jgi:hypothetical protein
VHSCTSCASASCLLWHVLHIHVCMCCLPSACMCVGVWLPATAPPVLGTGGSQYLRRCVVCLLCYHVLPIFALPCSCVLLALLCPLGTGVIGRPFGPVAVQLLGDHPAVLFCCMTLRYSVHSACVFRAGTLHWLVWRPHLKCNLSIYLSIIRASATDRWNPL